jgi:hypothetical protein
MTDEHGGRVSMVQVGCKAVSSLQSSSPDRHEPGFMPATRTNSDEQV